MAGLADFHTDMSGERSGQAELRAKYAKDERITTPDQFDAAAHAHAEHLEALHLLVVGLNAPHDGANARRQLVQAGQRFRGMVYCCHSLSKISFPAAMSNSPREGVDVIETGFYSSAGLR
jgi:hypothetical protein